MVSFEILGKENVIYFLNANQVYSNFLSLDFLTGPVLYFYFSNLFLSKEILHLPKTGFVCEDYFTRALGIKLLLNLFSRLGNESSQTFPIKEFNLSLWWVSI